MRPSSAAVYMSLAFIASTAYGQAIDACPSIPPACATVDANPPLPKQKCGTAGKLNKHKATSDELVIPPCTAASEDDCRHLCAYISDIYDYDTYEYYPSCQSLSFDKSTSTCSLWLKKLNALGFRAKPTSNVVHYSTHCYSSYISGRVLGYTGDYADWFYTGQNILDPNSAIGTPIDTVTFLNDKSDVCSVVESCRDRAHADEAPTIQVAYDDSAATWQCNLYNSSHVYDSDFTVPQTEFSLVYGYVIPLIP